MDAVEKQHVQDGCGVTPPMETTVDDFFNPDGSDAGPAPSAPSSVAGTLVEEKPVSTRYLTSRAVDELIKTTRAVAVVFIGLLICTSTSELRNQKPCIVGCSFFVFVIVIVVVVVVFIFLLLYIYIYIYICIYIYVYRCVVLLFVMFVFILFLSFYLFIFVSNVDDRIAVLPGKN